MRKTQTCPKCAGTHLAIVKKFQFPDHDSVSRVLPFPPITIVTPGWIGGKKEVGHFQAHLCMGCGYTEFYAEGLEGLEDLARTYPEQLQIVRKA